MRNFEAVVEVSHVGTENCPFGTLRRKSRERRQAGARYRAETRPHRATREEDPVRNVPLIAIVDDDPSFREALERLLGTFTFRVRSFASGEEFLESSELRGVSCLLLDLAMPGMNGLEVKQQLATRGLRIPTVFVTAHADEVEQHLMAAGAIAILPKPVDQQMLLRLVQRVVGEQ
jgi:FixJ family two-component response regulator